MNNECVIGIDIGGTNIRIGRTDEMISLWILKGFQARKHLRTETYQKV